MELIFNDESKLQHKSFPRFGVESKHQLYQNSLFAALRVIASFAVKYPPDTLTLHLRYNPIAQLPPDRIRPQRKPAENPNLAHVFIPSRKFPAGQ
jgi:hypothetical protein